MGEGTREFDIAGRSVGAGHPTFIIAELSGNHGQDLDRAVQMVEEAKRAGADAVKLQTYTADTLTIDSDREYFRIQNDTLWDGKTLHELYEEAYTPWEWQPKLKEVADRLGLILFSSPFDSTAVEFLEEMQVPAYKIASFENVDLGLIAEVARRGKPVIISTGLATLAEIEAAVTTARANGADDVALLKCTSAYPADPADANLSTIPHLARTFDVVAGLSDHTLGPEVAVAAVALGASIVERHFTLSRAEPGPDSAFSLEPAEFRQMVEQIRTTEKAVGGVCYGPLDTEAGIFRRSLFVVEPVAKGEVLTPQNVRSIRPGYGLAPRHLPEILGLRAARDLERGTPLSWKLICGADK